MVLRTARNAHALLSAVERGASVDGVAAGAVALAHTDAHTHHAHNIASAPQHVWGFRQIFQGRHYENPRGVFLCRSLYLS